MKDKTSPNTTDAMPILMIQCTRTDSENIDFQKLASALDAELRVLDGEEHVFFAELNKTGIMKHCIVAYENQIPVGCGAIREYSDNTVEVKRMYISKNHRGKGIASKILAALELWTKELGYTTCILETGNKQIDAMALYRKNGYKIMDNFGKYKGMESSICFEKVLDI